MSSTITRRFQVNAHRNRHGPAKGADAVPLGRAAEWDGENIAIELDTLPVGNWWGGVATLHPLGSSNEQPMPSTALRQFDVVAGKRIAREGVEATTKWIRVGSATDMGGYLSVDLTTRPEGNWWDGKLRLFIQKSKKVK